MRKYHPDGAQPPIPVWGPDGTADRMARAYDLPVDPGMREEFDFRRFEGPFTIGPFEVEPIRVDHPVEAFGLRVRAGGATLAYSGDTAPCAGLDELAAGADLLLAEASFRSGDDNPPHIHLTGADCGGGGDPRRLRAAGAHPRTALVRPRGRARRGPHDVRRPGRGGARRSRLRGLRRPTPNRSAPADGGTAGWSHDRGRTAHQELRQLHRGR